MARARIKLAAGQRFGRLIVVAEVEGFPKQRSFYVVCDCGRERTAQLAHLLVGCTTSCGCYRREQLQKRAKPRQPKEPKKARVIIKHGHAVGYGTPEYRAWRSMSQRCHNPKMKFYSYYGGRGISVCPEWRHDYSAFLAHIGRRPSSEYSLDRINNDGNYEPGNVRWATRLTQRHNRRPVNFLLDKRIP